MKAIVCLNQIVLELIRPLKTSKSFSYICDIRDVFIAFFPSIFVTLRLNPFFIALKGGWTRG